MKKTVTFTPCGHGDTEKKTRMLRKHEESDAELIQRAVTKLWGRRCWWWADNGLGLFYGQVMELVGQGQNTSRTYRMRVDITG
jgi:hypothetical protein